MVSKEWTQAEIADQIRLGYVLRALRDRAACDEAEGASAIGALPCPSGTHGDFVDGEVVPGDLPCRECGAAL